MLPFYARFRSNGRRAEPFKSFGGRGVSGRSPRATRRLAIEPLEDRCLLSAGALDTSFNGTGYAITAVSSSNTDFAYDVLVQPDHKVVTVGTSTTSKSPKISTCVVRHIENGQRDTGFGSNGIVSIGIGTSNYLRDATLQSDGKILLAGAVETGGWAGPDDFAIVRLNANGTLDKTFGKSGVVTNDLGSTQEKIEGIAVQPNGKIVVAGWTRLNTYLNGYQFALARYNANGTLDASFGTGGKVTTDLRYGDEDLSGLALQPDGKIVVAGMSRLTVPGWGTTTDFAVARYTANGALDMDAATGFGPVVDALTGTRAGFAVTQFPGYYAFARDVGIQPDGRIIVVGQAELEGGNWDYAVTRYNPDGSPDLSFNGSGVTTIDFTGGTNFDADYGRSLIIQSDGKIVVAGDPAPAGFGLARLNTDGSLDPTFGTGGRVLAPDGGLRDAYKVALQPWNGRIVAAGGAGSSKSNFAVARFLGDAALQATSAAPHSDIATLTDSQVQPLLAEAIARWSAYGVDTSALQNIDIRIADLGGTTLGLAVGHTIWLDDNAAGWGWFVDATPGDDSEYSTPSNQGEQGRIDMLTAIAHEVGHLLGYDHSAFGAMADTLDTGVRSLSAAATLPTEPDVVDSVLALDWTGQNHRHRDEVFESMSALIGRFDRVGLGRGTH